MPRFPHLCAVALPVALALSCAIRIGAQASGVRFPVTSTVVAAALTRSGLSVYATEIEIPSALSAATSEPQMHLTAAEILSDGRLRVRLACLQARECQPFFALVHLATAPQAVEALVRVQKDLQRTDTPVHHSDPDRMKAGQRATLLMGDAHMRIVLPVIAIDSGAPGAEIRVNSVDRKQTFRVVVLDSGTVQGMLP